LDLYTYAVSAPRRLRSPGNVISHVQYATWRIDGIGLSVFRTVEKLTVHCIC
jgi:hypothetical protein